jgi:rhamnulokinase
MIPRSPPKPLRCLVVDLGAGSGRAMIAEFADGRLSLAEIHRFDDLPLALPDGPHWDVAALERHLVESLRRADARGGRVDAIGIDSWGLDYALLDAEGAVLHAPYHYRHPRSQRGRDAFAVPQDALFAVTGTQDLAVNTIYQLFDEARHHPERHAEAEALLMMADFGAYILTGEKRSNLTLARTTGLLDIAAGDWSDALCREIGLPRRLLQPMIAPSEVCGTLRPELAAELGWAPGVPVVAVAGHDTASAVAALPLDDGSAFLILGSWSLIGVETAAPRLGDTVRLAGFGNEGGTAGRSILVKSLNGLHLIQRLRAAWAEQTGELLSFAEISARAAAEARPPLALDPSDPCFFNPPDMLAAVADQCARQGRPAPEGIGALALALYLGMAAEIAGTLACLERELGRRVPSLRVCGGGAQDAGFCELLARRLGRTVVAGPIEASSWGNAMLQLVGLGAISSLADGRALIARSDDFRDHLPD